jgi:hypothetical protein
VPDTSNHVNLFPLAPEDLNPPVPDTSNQVNLFPLAPVNLNPPVLDTSNQVTCFPSPAGRAESSTKSAAGEPVSPPQRVRAHRALRGAERGAAPPPRAERQPQVAAWQL